MNKPWYILMNINSVWQERKQLWNSAGVNISVVNDWLDWTKMSLDVSKPVVWFLTMKDSSQSAQLQRQAKILIFCMKQGELIYNKGSLCVRKAGRSTGSYCQSLWPSSRSYCQSLWPCVQLMHKKRHSTYQWNLTINWPSQTFSACIALTGP